jgi:hypothetical protein
MKHCCARFAMTWKTVLNRNRNPPMVRRAAEATGSGSSASGTIRFRMHCNWPRKKASLRRTSMPNLSASTPTTSPRSAPRRGARQPRPDALVLLAGFPASPPVGAHRKIRSRRGVYMERRESGNRGFLASSLFASSGETLCSPVFMRPRQAPAAWHRPASGPR